MTKSTFTSAEFKQNLGAAKKAARLADVVIAERGRPAYVLMSIENYRRLAGRRTPANGT